MPEKNVFITGYKQVGKSYMIQEILEKLSLEATGFKTLPYIIAGTVKGYYMHSLADCGSYLNDNPISVRYEQGNALPVTSVFDGFGAHVLRESRKDGSSVILMDELGVLEDSAETFKDEVLSCLDCKKQVLGVLKLADTPFLNRIRERTDTVVLELTAQNRLDVFKAVLDILKVNH